MGGSSGISATNRGSTKRDRLRELQDGHHIPPHLWHMQKPPWHTLFRHLYFDGEPYDLQYALESFWPSFDPDVSAATSPFVSNSWLAQAMNDKTLLYSFLWAASLHQFTIRRNDPIVLRMDLYRQQLLRDIIQETMSRDTATQDTVILAVTSLHPDTSSPPHMPLSPCQGCRPPYKKLQSWDLYSRGSFVEVHATAQLKMVRLRGGIDFMTMPVLRPLLQYTDLLRASMGVTTLAWALCQDYSEFLKANLPHPGFFLHHPGSIATLRLFRCHSIHRNIWDAIVGLKAYLALLEDSYVASENMSRLVVARNVSQHSVLSTPALPSEAISTTDHVLRQACLVFALGATFPVSHSLNLRTVCRRLSVAYAGYSQESPSEPPDFSSWICLLGAIAAKSCRSTTLYCGLVVVQKSRLKPPQDLFEITSSTQSYLWLDTACQHIAASVWQELAEKLSQHHGSAF